jgi:hypothetical protein
LNLAVGTVLAANKMTSLNKKSSYISASRLNSEIPIDLQCFEWLTLTVDLLEKLIYLADSTRKETEASLDEMLDWHYYLKDSLLSEGLQKFSGGLDTFYDVSDEES